ncbi:MAG: hypothetical protein ACK4TA_09075 [Saprospiraceae bacterium]
MKRKILLSGAFILLTIWLGYVVQRANFPALIITYSTFFILYFGITVSTSSADRNFWCWLGILLRVILLFNIPNLSDDLYRFIWDGRLIINGLNPFDHLPHYYIEHHILPESLTPALYEQLNSKSYYTIYPPIAQAVFALACWLFPYNMLGSMIVMKLILLSGEIGSILLIIKILDKLNLPKQQVILYALNPLLIFEIVGNLHFEGLMIFFLLLSFWLIITNRILFAALAMAGAIASKLVPLLLLPFLLTKFNIKKSLIYFTTLGITLILLFIPLLNTFFFNHFGESLNLYFRQFEFNASFYYIVRWLGYQIEGYNLVKRIGPALALLVFILIITFAIIRRHKDWQSLPESWLFAVSIYLLFATTVHPWYITLPLTFSIFTKWRYPVIWSGATWLSYSHYWGGHFQENYLLILTEYVIVMLFFIWEYKYRILQRN